MRKNKLPGFYKGNTRFANLKIPLFFRAKGRFPAAKLSGCNKAGKQALRAFCKAIRAL